MSFSVPPVAGGSGVLARDAQYPMPEKVFLLDFCCDVLEASKTDHVFACHLVWQPFKIIAATLMARVFTKTNAITFTIVDDSTPGQKGVNAQTRDTISNGAGTVAPITVDPTKVFGLGASLFGLYTSGVDDTGSGIILRCLCQPVF